jgi:nitroreductase
VTTALDVRRTALRRAAVRATLAPSTHNTQPWSLRLHGDRLDLRADRERQLTIVDPTGRQMVISCGAALLNARLSLASAGIDVVVERFPDARERDLVARITAVGDPRPQPGALTALSAPASLTTLDGFIDIRRTNRGPFTGDTIATEVLDTLAHAVAEEQGTLFVVTKEQHRAGLAAVGRHARLAQAADPALAAEARSWAAEEPRPVETASPPDRAPMPGPGGESLVVVCSAVDRRAGWLRSGEALGRLLLEATRQGLVAGPIAQTIVTGADRSALRAELGLAVYPQVLIKLGHAPASLASRRRRLVDVLVEDA